MCMIILCWGCQSRINKDENHILFWHTQTRENARALEEIVAGFNQKQKDFEIVAQYIGRYDQLYQKIIGAIRAGDPPDLAVAYESMVLEFMQAGVVAPLDPYYDELDLKEQGNYFDPFIATNRYPAYQNQLLSFPFTKSVLMLYYNADLLKKNGWDHPPRSWNEFYEICAAIKKNDRIIPYALSVDASKIVAMIYSWGGEVWNPDQQRTCFSEAAGQSVFQFIQKLYEEKLVYQIRPKSYDDQNALATGQAAFMIRSSTSRPFLQQLVGKNFELGMTILPKNSEIDKNTVLFGANICIFKSSDIRQRRAWKFIQYFTSSPVTALWATKTGYLPVKKGAIDEPVFKDFIKQDNINLEALNALPFAKAEPTIRGWQEIRSIIENNETAVITGQMDYKSAVKLIDIESDKIIQKQIN